MRRVQDQERSIIDVKKSFRYLKRFFFNSSWTGAGSDKNWLIFLVIPGLLGE